MIDKRQDFVSVTNICMIQQPDKKCLDKALQILHFYSHCMLCQFNNVLDILHFVNWFSCLSFQIVSLTGLGALREVQVPIINQSSCQSMYQILSSDLITVDVLSDMICAGYMEGGKDSCQVCYYYYTASTLTILPCK